MALKSPYLAAENSASDRRSRALHRFIVASPVLLLLAVGLVGHLRHPMHAGAAGSSDCDKRVLAYRDRVVAVESLPDDEIPPLMPALQEARRWEAGFENGQLTTLPPAAYEDHLSNGVRGEILRAGLGLSSNLSLASERRLDSGDASEAAEGAIVAGRVANHLRRFELQACLQSLLVQRRAVGVLARSWPLLTDAQRARIRPSLSQLLVDPKEVDELSKLEDGQVQDYFLRQRLPLETTKSKDYRLGDPAIAAIQRSIRLSNARVTALLHGKQTPTTTEELP